MRGKREGSIYKRTQDGMWVGAIELPPLNGTRRRKVIVGKDKATVIRKMNTAKTEAEARGDLPTDSQTVAQWFDHWLRMVEKDLRPKTMAGYRSMVVRNIVPTIGTVRLSKLTPAHVRRVHDTMLGAGLSSTSAKQAHMVMSSAFTAAEREGRIPRNPAKLTPAPRKAVTTLDVLDVAEAAQIIRTFAGQPDSYLWATFLLTGARRGEVLGLRWSAVTDVLDLEWQLQRHPINMVAPADFEYLRLDGGLYLTRPKSRAGTRTVPLVEPLAGILAHWRTVAPNNPHGLVFAAPDGKPWDPDTISDLWATARTVAGITKHVRLHDLRHTAVDMLYEAGVPEVVISEIVGHSSRSMTRAYKSRGNRPQLTDAMTRMSALLQLTPELGHESVTR